MPLTRALRLRTLGCASAVHCRGQLENPHQRRKHFCTSIARGAVAPGHASSTRQPGLTARKSRTANKLSRRKHHIFLIILILSDDN